MVNREAFRPVPNTQPPAAWIGGKRSLAPRLVKMIEAMQHQTYAEPFVGMGGVFFRRRQAPRTEVINDRSGDVVNLFRILQRHYPQFMDTLKFQITSRREFERLKACDPATLTDLERAARFIYLQKLAFGGKVAGQTFGVQHNGSARFNLTRLAPLLEDVHERLSGVVIENLDWLAFINRYDRPGVLFYLDPPYFGCEDDYGKALFGRDQFEVLADRLKSLQGGFILSINDRPEVREIFAGFSVEGAQLSYSVSGGKGTEARELIYWGDGCGFRET
ncbi:DNA adenine methylase [Agrobacterium vitis]|uniref:site-specific DNA-methyltransferase (adenine-specific) n=1 Tax=Agrobacterium vitis TaxID=373 RepID=A0ABD6GGS9_AGRVI|nr:DNA adenine methylase [Agrobacterium vitis]MUO82239.1 DNA adenine methylase [Agrobacterium vitis]MUO97563.1 DNA adenine methylase [Agrobacterium vitis]MUP08166.1 DNA adenine methylase [Agrobacterium vitis]MUZ85435.1 DNA adenine methylase [Agrobacterium vitis]MVA13079.1 DNA adenine methylase [Agrobacterium vitis]